MFINSYAYRHLQKIAESGLMSVTGGYNSIYSAWQASAVGSMKNQLPPAKCPDLQNDARAGM
jgi:hypothetical protein